MSDPSDEKLLDLLRTPAGKRVRGVLRSFTPTKLFTMHPKVGRYEVHGVIGSGGMGVVYAARDHESDDEVALELLLHESELGSSTEDARTRLLRES